MDSIAKPGSSGGSRRRFFNRSPKSPAIPVENAAIAMDAPPPLSKKTSRSISGENIADIIPKPYTKKAVISVEGAGTKIDVMPPPPPAQQAAVGKRNRNRSRREQGGVDAANRDSKHKESVSSVGDQNRPSSGPPTVSLIEARPVAKSSTSNAIRRPSNIIEPAEFAKALKNADPSALFTNLKLHPGTQRALDEVFGYPSMTDVQRLTLPVSLQGLDVFAKAKTGTGKTFAFMIPIIEKILKSNTKAGSGGSHPIHALVLSPSRELNLQTVKEASKLLSFHPQIGVQMIMGGTNMNTEVRNLRESRCDIILATPGRLCDHIKETPGFAARLAGVNTFILDEADRLLDMGFKPQLTEIIAKLPRDRQSLFFTATIPQGVHQIADMGLKSSRVFIDAVKEDDVATPVLITQKYAILRADTVLQALFDLLQRKVAEDPEHKIIVFFPTAKLVKALNILFAAAGMKTLQLHSRMSQSARTGVTNDFAANSGRVLLASDVVARGLDYPDVTLVVQVGVTAEDQYQHRVGRTGRAGKSGEALLLLAEEERGLLRYLKEMPLTPLEPSSDLLQPSSATRKPLKDFYRIPAVKEEIDSSFVSHLGSLNAFRGKFKWSEQDLVDFGKVLFEGLGMTRAPDIEKKILRKMGLTNARFN